MRARKHNVPNTRHTLQAYALRAKLSLHAPHHFSYPLWLVHVRYAVQDMPSPSQDRSCICDPNRHTLPHKGLTLALFEPSYLCMCLRKSHTKANSGDRFHCPAFPLRCKASELHGNYTSHRLISRGHLASRPSCCTSFELVQRFKFLQRRATCKGSF